VDRSLELRRRHAVELAATGSEMLEEIFVAG
jgi:hypothetical protein